MHETAKLLLWVTTILYLVTLMSVKYVGVYLTYFAIPFILLCLLVVICTKPSSENQKNTSKVVATTREISTASVNFLNEANKILDGVNSSLAAYNQKIQQENDKVKLKPDIASDLTNVQRVLSPDSAWRLEAIKQHQKTAEATALLKLKTEAMSELLGITLEAPPVPKPPRPKLEM
jgi:hypothetical protein